ncbi:MAG: ABC transporter permease subunit [Chloroflexota bacterium]
MPEYFPGFLQLPLTAWMDDFLHWLVAGLAPVLDAVSGILTALLSHVEQFLFWLPWFVAIIIVGIIGWRVMRLWWAGLALSLLLGIIGVFGYWQQAMLTLAMVIVAVVIALILGIPLGFFMARSDPLASFLRPILEAMQTIPGLVYLLPALIFFGLGKVPAVLATLLYAMPPVVRLTNVGIRQVSPAVVEAAKASGSTPWQVLREAQFPLAFPAILVGINQTTMMALTMVVIASLIGAPGLGLDALNALTGIELGRSFTAGLSIVLLAVIIDRLTHVLAARQPYPARNGTQGS